MGKIFAAIALMCVLNSTNAQRILIQAKVNGDWQTAATWNPARVPADNDSIVIPAGTTVTINSSGIVNLKDIRLDILGTLVMDERNGQSRGLIITTTESLPVFLIRLKDAGSSIKKGTSGNRSSTISVKVNNSATATTKYSTDPQGDFGTTTPPPGQSFGPTVTGPAFAQNTATNPLFFITGSNGALPLSLTGFRAGINGNNITLSWTSLLDMSTQSFVIEKSSNGSSWSPIGTVAVTGSLSSPNNYQFVDSKGSDVNFYRIRIIGLAGNTTYSSVLAVKLNNAGTNLSLFPNPATNSVNIAIGRIPSQHGFTIKLFNTNGQLMTSQQIAAGTNVLSLDVSHYTSGNYNVQIKFEDGTTEVRKLLISK